MPGPAAPAQPARVLGAFDATCVVVGAIIGVGIFFNPTRVAALTGDAGLALGAWAIAGGIALCGALTFAALGTRYHANGAHYEVLRDAYGPFPAFLFVFCNATAIQAGAAGVIAVVCAQNLAAVAGRAPPEGPLLLAISAVLIVGLALANIVGVRWGSAIQNLTVVLKVLTLLLVTALAVFAAPDAAELNRATPPVALKSPVAALLAALVPCLFAYGGWQHSLWISGEVKNPRRNLPRAIVGGVLLVVVVYLLANWAYLRLLGVGGVAAADPLAANAAAAVWPRSGARIIAAAVAVSAFGVLNAQLLSGPRLVYGMARDGRFFSVFGRLHPRLGTPVAAIALIGGMALVLLLISGSEAVKLLTTGAVYIDAVFFALTGVALFVLRRKHKADQRAAGGTAPPSGEMRTPGFPMIPALFVVGEVGVVVGAHLDPDVLKATLFGTAWIAVAAVLYFIRFRRGAAT